MQLCCLNRCRLVRKTLPLLHFLFTHLKRARYNAASITAKETEPGEYFEDVPNVIIVYITESDFLGAGRTIYHIDKVIRESGKVIDDGLKEVFVNTSIDDGTLIAGLMRCFLQKEVHDPRFPKLSSRVSYLKEEEGGISVMCEVMESYLQEATREAAREAAIEARKIERQKMIQAMIRNNIAKDIILSMDVTEEEYAEAEQMLLAKA